jgi:hypothetical protein
VQEELLKKNFRPLVNLGKTYKNTKTLISVECKVCGKRQTKSFNQILMGQGCNNCNQNNVNQKICRATFERIFDEDFLQVYPRWLTTKEHERLQLDGFCERLGIAFEYQGEQHYHKKAYFATKSSFRDLVRRDAAKREACVHHGVLLIEIPYTVTKEKIPQFIISKPLQNGVPVRKSVLKLQITDLDVTIVSTAQKLHKKLSEHGDTLLSRQILGISDKVLIRCGKCHHEYEKRPECVLSRDEFCPKCAYLRGAKARLSKRYTQQYNL